MAKLSRKEKYQDLRNSLEQESEPQVTPKQVRSPRMAAPDFKTDQKARGPVIEDLLGEVKQYNLDNGELVTDDTQMQILHDLSSQEQAAARRSVHFETMEQDEEIGGTTRNFYGSDLSSFMTNQAAGPSGSSSSRSRQPKVNQTQSKKAQSEEPDFLDLFTPGQSAETPEPMVEVVEDQEKTKEKPILFNNNRRKRRKVQRQVNQIEGGQEDLEKTLDNQSLEGLFSTAQVAVKNSYFVEEDDGPELPFTNRSAPSQDYQEPVEEDFEEEEVSTNPMASFFQKFQRKKQESFMEEEENEEYQEEVPVVQPKKAKQNGTPTKSAKQTKSSQGQTAKKTTNKGTKSQDNSQSANTAAVIFMVVCCVILLLLILLTIFFMSKLGIF